MSEPTLTTLALNRALLARQMLLAREKMPPVRAVERLVGLQAQQARPPFIGLWSRVEGFERAKLLWLIQDRKVVRATMMRGTLHLMSAEDYLALRAAMQPMLTSGMRAVLKDSVKKMDVRAVLDAALQHFARPCTFADLRSSLLEAFPNINERAMGYLVRTHLPLVAAPNDSPWGYGADAPFTAAEGWLGKPPHDVEDTPALVLKYLAAFGPASVRDVQAWSGLANLKNTLEGLRPKLRVFRDERKRELFDLPNAPRPGEDVAAPVRFLPGFDNAILAHADRARIISEEYRPRVVTRNLQVLATFLVNGFVAGTWATDCRKGTATLTISPFAKLSAATKRGLVEEGEKLVRFAEPDAEDFTVRYEG